MQEYPVHMDESTRLNLALYNIYCQLERIAILPDREKRHMAADNQLLAVVDQLTYSGHRQILERIVKLYTMIDKGYK